MYRFGRVLPKVLCSGWVVTLQANAELLRHFSETSSGVGICSQSRLANGIRVASLGTPGPCIAGGVLVETFSNSRVPPTPGNSASLCTLEKLAYKADLSEGSSF